MAVFHIAWRELRAILATGVAWFVICVFLVLSGVFWLALVTNYVRESQNLVFNPYAASMLTLGDFLIAPWFGNVLIVLIFFGPAIAMRLFTEEYRHRTMELLLTSPVRTWEIVAGKYLGAMGFGVLMLLFTAHVPIALYSFADPDWGFFVGGYLMLLMVLSVLISLTMLASSYTESQMLALSIGLVGGLTLYLVSWLATDPTGWLAQLSMASHVEDVLRGALRLSDLTYFACASLVFLFATQQRLESFRWS